MQHMIKGNLELFNKIVENKIVNKYRAGSVNLKGIYNAVFKQAQIQINHQSIIPIRNQSEPIRTNHTNLEGWDLVDYNGDNPFITTKIL